jgi:hypothetical protein
MHQELHPSYCYDVHAYHSRPVWPNTKHAVLASNTRVVSKPELITLNSRMSKVMCSFPGCFGPVAFDSIQALAVCRASCSAAVTLRNVAAADAAAGVMIAVCG